MDRSIDQLASYIWLSRLVTETGIGVPRMRRVMAAFESVEALYEASPDVIAEHASAPPECILRIKRFVRDAKQKEEAVQAAEKGTIQGIGCLTDTDPLFPARLKEIGSCPFLLFYQGDIEKVLTKAEFVVTIVGSRSPTGYGRTATREIAAEIAQAGVTVVSGMARGIDSIAHRAALEAGGLTAAVLGGGIDHIYPPEHGESVVLMSLVVFLINARNAFIAALFRHFTF